MKAPKYIQIAIRRMFYHQKVVRNNADKVNQWLSNNKIDRNIPLNEFVDSLDYKRKKQFVAKGQMTIFDYIGGAN